MKRFSKILISSLFIIVLSTALGTHAFAKTVNLEWKPIKGASAYEIQIAKKGNTFLKKKLEETSWSGNLSFGVFSYQIRAYDKLSRPGPWSQPLALVVMPQATEGTHPDNGAKVTLFSPTARVTVRWKPIAEIQKYRVKLYRNRATFQEKTVEGTATDFAQLPQGEYSWTVSGIIEASGRSPSSFSNKKWESKPSDEMSFKVGTGNLEAPRLLYPIEAIAPPKDTVVPFKWSEIEGAERYELTLLPQKGAARTPAEEKAAKVFVVKDNKVSLRVPVNGRYRWQVRGLANVDSKNTATATGPKSEATFDLNKNAMFVDGSGYVALSTMIAPYTYRIVDPSTNSEGSLKSSSITLRLSGEYWFLTHFGLAAAIENTSFTISGRDYNRRSFELLGKYRANLSRDKYGWSITPKAGLEGREYFFISPDLASPGSISSSSFIALGATVGVDIRKQFNDLFSLGAKVSYFQPVLLTGAPGGGSMSSEASYRNLSVGLQGLAWLTKHWGVGLGAFYENRSISFNRPNVNGASEVYMDATYFFGSLIYSFGR